MTLSMPMPFLLLPEEHESHVEYCSWLYERCEEIKGSTVNNQIFMAVVT